MLIEWRDVKGYEGLYKISNKGDIFSYRFNRILKFHKSSKGYMRIGLSDENGVRKFFSSHRLVALSFIPNPHKLETVDHINENKSDNRIENLQWLSMHDNIRKSKLGKKLSKSHRTNLRLSHLGLPSGSDRFNVENAVEMKEQLLSGIDPIIIGKRFGIGRTTVYNHIKRLKQ